MLILASKSQQKTKETKKVGNFSKPKHKKFRAIFG
jgi:hypothetical protein